MNWVSNSEIISGSQHLVDEAVTRLTLTSAPNQGTEVTPIAWLEPKPILFT